MSRTSWCIPILIGLLCWMSGAGLMAQEPPVVLIDATVLPPTSDTLSDEVLQRKLNAVGDEGGVADPTGSRDNDVPSRSTTDGVALHQVTKRTPDKALPACVGIDVRSSIGQLFSDSFESGDLTAWSGSDVVFSADGALDLFFDVYFDGTLVGDHVLRLELTTPRGHHYQTLTAPISSQTSALGSQRRLEGFPYPVDVEILEAVGANASSASLQLPVAGTSIVTHGLYGVWTIEAFVDQATEPCGEAGEFRLVP